MRDLWENASVDRGKFRYNSPFYRIARRLETRVLRGADAVVTICDTLKDDLSTRVADPSRVFVVGNGVDAESFDPVDAGSGGLARDWGLTGKQVIAYVGTFQPYEGLDLLIGALPQVLARRPAAHLVIAGGSAGESTAAETSLQAQVDRLGPSVERHVYRPVAACDDKRRVCDGRRRRLPAAADSHHSAHDAAQAAGGDGNGSRGREQ